MLLGVLAIGGCEFDSFLDPSVVGRWEPTPMVLPILKRLDVIDEPLPGPQDVTQVQPEDLIYQAREYTIGPGDAVSVSVFELLTPGQNTVQTLRVDELGMFRHPILGPIKAAGLTPSQLEHATVQIIKTKDILRGEPTVSAVVLEGQHNTFTVISDVNVSGIYQIVGTDFRLLDATALSRAVPFRTNKIYMYRQVRLDDPVMEIVETAGQTVPKPASPTDTEQLIDEIFKGLEPDPATDDSGESTADDPAPVPIALSLDEVEGQVQWVNVDDQWVRANAQRRDLPAELEGVAAQSSPVVTQRIIEIPYDKLLEGDLSYNIVIRSGDIIRIPEPIRGNVYMGGAILRRGTFNLPPEPTTLKQIVIAAGGLSALATPERVDLIRRIAPDQEAMVRVNLRAIFEGKQPDFFMKPNDIVNVGNSFPVTPLAVFRNGFRVSYGFGFVLDRNFGFDVFGPTYRR